LYWHSASLVPCPLAHDNRVDWPDCADRSRLHIAVVGHTVVGRTAADHIVAARMVVDLAATGHIVVADRTAAAVRIEEIEVDHNSAGLQVEVLVAAAAPDLVELRSAGSAAVAVALLLAGRQVRVYDLRFRGLWVVLQVARGDSRS